MGNKSGSDIANRVGEFEANTNLSQKQELYAAAKAWLKEDGNALTDVGKQIANALSNYAK
jgi:hypothetical protein